MAAVTLVSQSRLHIAGDLCIRFYTITGSTGNTLQLTGQTNLDIVLVQPGSAITGYTQTTPGPQGAILTFTASGAITAETICVISSKTG